MNMLGTSAFEASESCTQEFLLSVASAVNSLVDPSDLAKCLGISLNDTDEGDTARDKALNLFLLWQSANCGANSKAKFFTCLQQLNNASINEILIKKYHAGWLKSLYYKYCMGVVNFV